MPEPPAAPGTSEPSAGSAPGSRLGPRPGSRIEGFDLARALAVLGMVIVNFKLVMTTGAEPAGDPAAWLELVTGLDGKAAATFVVLAGIGVSLGARRAASAVGPEAATLRARARRVVLARAALLFVVGLAYTPLWPADILHFYGVFLALGALVLFAPTRSLWTLAGLLVALFPLLAILFDYEAGWDWETLEYAGFWTPSGLVRHLVFNGFHPVVPWAAFLLVGMALGRLDWSAPRLALRVAGTGLVGLVAASVPARLLAGPAAALEDQELAELATLLLATDPMPPLPLYLLAGTSAACLVIGLAAWLTPRLGAAARPLIATGQLALTLYVAHVVIGMGVLEVLGLMGAGTLGQSLAASLVFYAAAIAFAVLWRRRFERGPLEALFRASTRRLVS